MKKLLVSALVFAFASTGLFAASDWEGFYFGGAIGGANHTSYWTDVDFDWNGATLDLNKNGLIIGGVVGYNWVPNTVVYGVELDLNIATIENGTRYSDDVDITDELKSLFMLKGRVGVPAGPALLYATAGVATGSAEHSWEEDNDPDDSWSSIDNSNLGWVVGAGVEHQLSDVMSIKFEFDKVHISAETDENDNGFTMRVSEGVTAFRVGLNWNL